MGLGNTLRMDGSLRVSFQWVASQSRGENKELLRCGWVMRLASLNSATPCSVRVAVECGCVSAYCSTTPLSHSATLVGTYMGSNCFNQLLAHGRPLTLNFFQGLDQV